MLLVLTACDAKPAAPAPASTAPAPAKQVSSAELTPTIPPPAIVEQILAQRVLDHLKVAPYLHTEVAGNLPLRVAPSPDLAQGVARLQVAGQSVQVVDAGEARVVFKGRERIGAARERVRFEIPPEGVAGHVDLELADNVWTAVDVAVVER